MTTEDSKGRQKRGQNGRTEKKKTNQTVLQCYRLTVFTNSDL